MVETGVIEAFDALKMEFQKGYPISTFIIKELILHCQALGECFCATSPLMVPICLTDAHKIHYVVGDASVEDFFIMTQYLDQTISTHGGLWKESFTEG